MEEIAPGTTMPNFSTAKRAVLEAVQKMGEPSLEALAAAVGRSKMATLKHLQDLEAHGLLQRTHHRGARGRPRVHFSLSAKGIETLPKAYSQLTSCALSFIEERMGRPAVGELLERRAAELYATHRADLRLPTLEERVATLTRLRDSGGYMARQGTATHEPFELLEYNCPIIEIAQRYGEACTAERRLFERLLNADVEVTHRVVDGSKVCRFLIKARAPSSAN